jgi:hypothetical protein
MGVYTSGELRKGYWRNESGGYGVIPTDALLWGCDILRFRPAVDLKQEEYITSGSRSFSDSCRGPYDVGFNIEGYARAVTGGYSWRNFWAVYGLGYDTAMIDHLTSFIFQATKKVGTNYYYNVYNGCKPNMQEIRFDKHGQPLVFGMDAFSQFIIPSTSKNFTGLQTVTVGADPSNETGAMLIWQGDMQINIAAGGLVTFKPKKARFWTEHNLERQYGIKVGDDGSSYPVACALDEGPRRILFEADMPHGNETYVNAKLANSACTALTLPVGANTITLSDGVFIPNELPTLEHKQMSEKFTVSFKSFSIA